MSVLDELERLEKAATPGPWDFDGEDVYGAHGERDGIAEVYGHAGVTPGDLESSDANGQLIAASRNALPALLRLARAAEREFNHPEEEVRFEAGRDVRQALRDLGVEV